MSYTLLQARLFLGALRPGDPVTITVDGRDILVTVQRSSSSEPGGFGHPDSARTTVGFGPGRWNTEVTPAGIAEGRHVIRLGH